MAEETKVETMEDYAAELEASLRRSARATI